MKNGATIMSQRSVWHWMLLRVQSLPTESWLTAGIVRTIWLLTCTSFRPSMKPPNANVTRPTYSETKVVQPRSRYAA